MDYQNINGCGHKGSIVRPPHSLFFKASCDIHDISYTMGGSEIDRIRADTGFLRAMIQDCERVEGIKKSYLLTWAYLYYFAVRLFGSRFFVYYVE